MKQSERLAISMDNIRKMMQRHQPVMSIPKSEFMMLKFISEDDAPKLSDISNKLHISNAATSQIIASLESKKLVKRTMSKEDRRIIYVSLTDKGIKTIMEAKKIMHQFMEGVVNNLGSEDSEDLIRILGKLEKLLEEGVICREIIN
jgi:DNA-binding MarR family transcriptional regulator